MAIEFPNSPIEGDQFTASNGVIYTYENGGWNGNSASGLEDVFVNISGDEMTGDLTVPSLNGGPLGGFRNQLINGDFRVWQRGNPITLSVTSGSAELYSADRWAIGVTSGNNITVTRSATAPAGFAYSILTTNAGAIQQGVELPEAGNAGAFAIGTTWTFSVWHNQDITSRNPAPTFRDKVATPGNDSAAGTASNWVSTGETSTSGGVTFTRYFSTVTINAAPNSTNLVFNIYISGGAHFSDTSTYFTGVQLEPGPVATPFEHRPIGTELALCQRYYQIGRLVFRVYKGTAGTISSLLQTTMRTLGTVVTGSTSGGSISTARLQQGYGRHPSAIQLSTLNATEGNEVATDFAVDAEL